MSERVVLTGGWETELRGQQSVDATTDLAQRMDLESEPVYSLPTFHQKLSLRRVCKSSHGPGASSHVYLVQVTRFWRITEIFIPVKILRVLRLLSVRAL